MPPAAPLDKAAVKDALELLRKEMRGKLGAKVITITVGGPAAHDEPDGDEEDGEEEPPAEAPPGVADLIEKAKRKG